VYPARLVATKLIGNDAMPGERWQITRDMFLDESEVVKLLRDVRDRAAKAVPDKPTAWGDRLLIELLLFSGLRPSEFCRLTTSDVVMTETKSYLEVEEAFGATREVFIPRWLGRELVRYGKRGMEISLTLYATDAIPLFKNERYRAYERTALYRRVTRILTAAGLGDRASIQLLRHTYGYLAYKRTGGNLLFVQRQLGHAHPMVTAVYAQFVDENPAQLADTIAAADQPPPSKEPRTK
jgi:integrase/recombinase XerD